MNPPGTNIVGQCKVLGTEAAGVPWCVIYTRPRHEKTVAKQLAERSIESFLPSYQKMHQWKDRKKLVCLPIFSGYVFARVPWCVRLTVLQLPGVVRFVGPGGIPTRVPEAEMQALRRAVEAGTTLHPQRYLKVGRRVQVCRGPLSGSEGLLVRRKGSHRLVLSIDLIQRSVAVEVDVGDVVNPISEIGRSNTQGIRASLETMRAGAAKNHWPEGIKAEPPA